AKSQEGDPSMVDVPYREAVGCLQYLAVTIRPNIAFAVVFASRALCKPTKDDWKHVERIYIYLRGTSNVGLLYKSHVQTEFSVSSDADHAGDEKTRRSTSAEYVAASEASNQLVWLKLLFKELFEYDGSPFLYVDNQCAIKVAQNPQHQRTCKHIHVRFNSITEKVERGVLKSMFHRQNKLLIF
ncbi:Retrovirus-related Pol polyprotein from transposon TNT 1-94, partial [Araneus ventricosus]